MGSENRQTNGREEMLFGNYLHHQLSITTSKASSHHHQLGIITISGITPPPPARASPSHHQHETAQPRPSSRRQARRACGRAAGGVGCRPCSRGVLTSGQTAPIRLAEGRRPPRPPCRRHLHTNARTIFLCVSAYVRICVRVRAPVRERAPEYVRGCAFACTCTYVCVCPNAPPDAR